MRDKGGQVDELARSLRTSCHQQPTFEFRDDDDDDEAAWKRNYPTASCQAIPLELYAEIQSIVVVGSTSATGSLDLRLGLPRLSRLPPYGYLLIGDERHSNSGLFNNIHKIMTCTAVFPRAELLGSVNNARTW